MKWIEISPPISERSAVWPGDEPFRRKVSLSVSSGDNIELSSITSTLHIGAHADAPSHYLKEAQSIDQCDLFPYYGPCQVIEVRVPRGERIYPKDLDVDIQAPRVLFRTDSALDPENFNTDFNSLSRELVEHLSQAGCVLVGIDTPSIDLFDDRKLESHHTLARCGMRNLEGLYLSGVQPGLYTLVALPLRISGADASPVRAILIENGS